MNKEIISEHIITSLEDIIEQTNTIFEHSGKIPQIELDIVMGNIRNLYEHYTQLQRINQGASNFAPASKPAPTQQAPDTSAPAANTFRQEPAAEASTTATEKPAALIVEKEEIKEEKPEAKATARAEETKESPQSRAEEVSSPDKSIIEETSKNNKVPQEETAAPKNTETTTERQAPTEATIHIEEETNATEGTNEQIDTTPIEESETETKSEAPDTEEEVEKPKVKSRPKPKSPLDLFSDTIPTIADKFKDESPSLNQKIVEGKKDKSIASRMQKQPIVDLTKAIGINEKFLFINDLFNGNMSEYNTAIKHINSECPGIEQARAYISSLEESNKWDNKPSSAELFVELVERRFLQN